MNLGYIPSRPCCALSPLASGVYLLPSLSFLLVSGFQHQPTEQIQKSNSSQSYLMKSDDYIYKLIK